MISSLPRNFIRLAKENWKEEETLSGNKRIWNVYICILRPFYSQPTQAENYVCSVFCSDNLKSETSILRQSQFITPSNSPWVHPYWSILSWPGDAEDTRRPGLSRCRASWHREHLRIYHSDLDLNDTGHGDHYPGLALLSQNIIVLFVIPRVLYLLSV